MEEEEEDGDILQRDGFTVDCHTTSRRVFFSFPIEKSRVETPGRSRNNDTQAVRKGITSITSQSNKSLLSFMTY